MNELGIKDVSWKHCGSELSKVILKILQKVNRDILSRSYTDNSWEEFCEEQGGFLKTVTPILEKQF